MTYTIAPDSPKAVKARAFADELRRALAARDIPAKELARAVGIGKTAIWHYGEARVLPKTATALAMAEVLRWPRLAELIVEARTFPCQRPGCTRTFRNEGGGPKRYCSASCIGMVRAQGIASRRLRRAGQTGDGRARAAAVARLRSAARIADERARVAELAVAVMCRSCEPDGLCRDAECPLRAVSPLPLAEREGTGHARTLAAIRRATTLGPAAAAKRSAAMKATHAIPGYTEAITAKGRATRAEWTDEQRREVGRRISAGRRRSA